jgi:hypothetical protein
MMVRHASLFSQLLRLVPRGQFDKLLHEHGAEKGAKGFKCWTQFVAMVFCHLGRADSLREICNGLACCVGKLVHIGVARAPVRSTLSYANEHRPAAFFEALFWHLAEHLRSREGIGQRKSKFRFKNKLLSLDSTTISLCLSLFPWAKFRRAKGGVKVHVLLDHDDYMPSYVVLTEARRHDRVSARLLNLNPGSIVAMDRAYNDYQLFASWTEAGIFFVTRMKENAPYEVVEEREPPQNSWVLLDQTIRLSSSVAKKKCPHLLRRVVVWDEENGRAIVFLTNLLEFGATTIAAIYRDRWEIELFFKTLKTHLKVKTFVGTTENALRIQIWTALIALLLLKWLKHQSHASWSFSNLAAMLRLNLFTYKDLLEWLKEPFGPPSDADVDFGAVQLHFALPGFGQPQNA